MIAGVVKFDWLWIGLYIARGSGWKYFNLQLLQTNEKNIIIIAYFFNFTIIPRTHAQYRYGICMPARAMPNPARAEFEYKRTVRWQ